MKRRAGAVAVLAALAGLLAISQLGGETEPAQDPAGAPSASGPAAHRHDDAARSGRASAPSAPSAPGAMAKPHAGVTTASAGASGATNAPARAGGATDDEPRSRGPRQATAAPKRWPVDREGIRGAVREALPQVKDCYESWLEINPNLGGTLTVKFRIIEDAAGEGGVVADAALGRSDMDHPFLEGCVLNAMSDLRFDRPPDGEVNVAYPLHFSSPDAGAADAG